MNREEKSWLTEKVNNNAYFKSAVPLQGWRFDFSVFCTFLVCQYGRWTEYKATDKTGLRRCLYGRIDNIVELEKVRPMTATANFRQVAQYMGLATNGLIVRTAFGILGILWASSRR